MDVKKEKIHEIHFQFTDNKVNLQLFDDSPYKYDSIWNGDVFYCFGNIKTLDQTLVELEQLCI